MRYEYQVAGEPVALQTDDDLVAVRYQPGTARSMRAPAATAASGDFTQRVEVMVEPLTIVHVQPRAVDVRAAVARALEA